MGARLRQGPMYLKYNAVLRSLRTDAHPFRLAMAHLCCASRVAEAFEAGAQSWEQVRVHANSYVTTIHCINSAIVKLGKLMSPGRLYRGLSGGVLPPQFFADGPDAVACGAESAFMSATLSREVAVQYACAQRSRLLLELDCGAYGCGADLGWCSQYPAEREVVFAPLTGIEVLDTCVDGDLVVARMRVTVNLNSPPFEKVARKRLYAHLQLVDLLRDDLRQASAPTNAVLSLEVTAVGVDPDCA